MKRTCALLRAEFTKFRTVRSRMITLCAAAVAFVLLATLSAFASRAPVRGIPVGPGSEAVSDTYMFVHQSLVGDGAMTARVAALSGAQLEPGLAPWAKAGIILEPGTNQGTSYAAVMVTGSHDPVLVDLAVDGCARQEAGRHPRR